MENIRNQKSASNIKPLDQKPITSENQDEDICAICMGSYENMSHPNKCFHKYCFGCLEEWSKIKPECPLCLKKITSITHSIRIDGTSEKYLLPQPPSIFKQIKNDFGWAAGALLSLLIYCSYIIFVVYIVYKAFDIVVNLLWIFYRPIRPYFLTN